MKVKSIKSIYLSREELKDAVYNFLSAQGYFDLAEHLKKNLCEFEWTDQEDGTYLAIDMDGTFEEH